MLDTGLLRWLVASLMLAGVVAANLLNLPETSLWRTDNRAFTTFETIQDPPWVKGTATLLAFEFQSVEVRGLAEGQEALLFDNELAEIYGIETDSTETAIDLSDQSQLLDELRSRNLVRFEFETFCRVADSQYCPVALVWLENAGSTNASAQFETVRIDAAEFALIERALLESLANELSLDLSQRVPE